MRTARSLPYGEVSMTETSPGQRSPWTETPLLERDPPPGQRPPLLDRDCPDRDPSGQRPPLDGDPHDGYPLDRDRGPLWQRPSSWTESSQRPLWTETHRDPPGWRPPWQRPRPPLPWTDKHLWKHNPRKLRLRAVINTNTNSFEGKLQNCENVKWSSNYP